LPGGKLPEVARVWVEGRESDDTSEGGKQDKQARAATEWVLEALCYAYADPRLKKAARELLVVNYFTINLEALGECFSDLLKPVAAQAARRAGGFTRCRLRQQEPGLHALQRRRHRRRR